MKRFLISLAVLVMVSAIAYAATVQGTVVDADNGDVIEGAFVRFIFTGELRNGCGGNGNGNGHGGPGGGGHGNNVYTATTDENGFYMIEDIPEGIYIGRALKPGSYQASVINDIEIIDITEVDFELEPRVCTNPILRLFRGGLRF
jgi:hypothetical protein